MNQIYLLLQYYNKNQLLFVFQVQIEKECIRMDINDKEKKPMVMTNPDDLRILNFLKSYKENFEERGRIYFFVNTPEYKETMNFFNMMIDKIEKKFIEKAKEYNLQQQKYIQPQ
eukprot:TRINITY_DN18623_c0_g1_i1.p6 TRINITY_DN18623_c0_g1~~TRINITY_DN18623_c0_g1_i1.p6  ORF type:complete len:114 (-),score=27.47 TRINITY_DN18623_c0_g1_i1:103-444(-)